ncbi:MAG: methyltransferase domain-containing protein [Candidatus Hydrogenedentes bacterium]|nr:methyltransferase domain-containing protein [Candidatus Hydrogenedentota bacterium]
MTPYKPGCDFSVLVPVLAHTENLAQILQVLRTGLERFPAQFEILVGAQEGMEEVRRIAEKEGATFVGVKSSGYGNLILDCVHVAKGNYILTIDPDAAYPMDAVRKLWMAHEDADVLIGSRYVALSHVEQPWIRNALSWAMNTFFATVLSTPIRDLSSGFRLYRRDVFRRLEFRSKSLAFLLETLLKFAGNGISVKEIPFHYKLQSYRKAQAHGFRLGIECLASLRALWRMRNSVECADYDLRAFNSRIPLQRYWQRKRYRLLVRFAETDARILDVGCGSGRFIADLSSGFGVDIRPEKLRYMRSFNPLLVAADGLSLPFPDQSFECVVSSEVIEHIPNENGRFIDELTRVLKPGGVLVLGTPDYDSRTWRFFEYLYGKAAPDAYAHEHVTHYTFSTLVSALESRGYGILNHGCVMGSIIVIQARKTGDGDRGQASKPPKEA